MTTDHDYVGDANQTPSSPEPALAVFGCMAGTAEIVGDLEARVASPGTWREY